MTREIDPKAATETLARAKLMLIMASADIDDEDSQAAIQRDIEMITALILREEQRAANLADGLRH